MLHRLDMAVSEEVDVLLLICVFNVVVSASGLKVFDIIHLFRPSHAPTFQMVYVHRFFFAAYYLAAYPVAFVVPHRIEVDSNVLFQVQALRC